MVGTHSRSDTLLLVLITIPGSVHSGNNIIVSCPLTEGLTVFCETVIRGLHCVAPTTYFTGGKRGIDFVIIIVYAELAGLGNGSQILLVCPLHPWSNMW